MKKSGIILTCFFLCSGICFSNAQQKDTNKKSKAELKQEFKANKSKVRRRKAVDSTKTR